MGSPTAKTSPKPSPGPRQTSTSLVQPIQVSQEIFTQAFSQIEALINTLNDIIKREDYDAWTAFLSDDYKNRFAEPDYLLQLSQSAFLQKKDITLKTLKDYFIYVVVPSRANLRLDDLAFLSETEVEAIMVVGNRRVTLYRLIKIGNQWLIGLS